MANVYQKLITARKNTNINPSEKAIELGNYSKGLFIWNPLSNLVSNKSIGDSKKSMKICIENPKGSVRSGVDSKGKSWNTTMLNDYGYFKNSLGADGDHVDVFIGKNLNSEIIYIIDQKFPDTGGFDEHKCIIGANSKVEAKKIYLQNYNKGWKGFGGIRSMHYDTFVKWVFNKNATEKESRQY